MRAKPIGKEIVSWKMALTFIYGWLEGLTCFISLRYKDKHGIFEQDKFMRYSSAWVLRVEESTSAGVVILVASTSQDSRHNLFE